jgi:hypothetical protein
VEESPQEDTGGYEERPLTNEEELWRAHLSRWEEEARIGWAKMRPSSYPNGTMRRHHNATGGSSKDAVASITVAGGHLSSSAGLHRHRRLGHTLAPPLASTDSHASSMEAAWPKYYVFLF